MKQTDFDKVLEAIEELHKQAHGKTIQELSYKAVERLQDVEDIKKIVTNSTNSRHV